jgi:hypothetical protein
MSEESDGLSGWLTSPSIQERMRESTEAHQLDPGTTLEQHVARQRARLQEDLNGRTLIYLDTNHWVNLCHVVVQSNQQLPIYSQILGQLESLRQRNRICCPVSSTLFHELMRQCDASTRLATARIMDYLSGGACLQNWLELAKAEFGLHICRTFHIDYHSDSSFPIWTKVGFWPGEHTFNFPELPAKEGDLMRKVYWDLRWGMTVAEFQDRPGWTPIPDAFSAAWLDGARLARSHQAATPRSFRNLVRQRRRELLAALKDTLLPMLAFCQGLPGSPADQVAAALGPIYEGRDAHALPSIEVVAGLDAAITSDVARRPHPNDMADYLHAAQALPHCDALLCDNFMAQKAISRPLEFAKIYKTEIRSRPEEIIAYLDTLA